MAAKHVLQNSQLWSRLSAQWVISNNPLYSPSSPPGNQTNITRSLFELWYRQLGFLLLFARELPWCWLAAVPTFSPHHISETSSEVEHINLADKAWFISKQQQQQNPQTCYIKAKQFISTQEICLVHSTSAWCTLQPREKNPGGWAAAAGRTLALQATYMGLILHSPPPARL